MNKEKIKEFWHRFTEGDTKDVEYYKNHFNGWGRSAGIEDRLLFNENRLLNLMVCLGQIMKEVTEEDEDPCPGCKKGGVCRTIACGRLKLPTNHPLRNST